MAKMSLDRDTTSKNIKPPLGELLCIMEVISREGASPVRSVDLIGAVDEITEQDEGSFGGMFLNGRAMDELLDAVMELEDLNYIRPVSEGIQITEGGRRIARCIIEAHIARYDHLADHARQFLDE